MKSKTANELTFFEQARSLLGWYQHFRIILSMLNTIVAQFAVAFLPAYFAYFALVYGVTVISDLISLSIELSKKDVDKIKMIAAAESALTNFVWATAYLLIVLFFVSNPIIAVTVFMAGTIYDIGFSVYKLYDGLKKETDATKQDVIKKDAFVNIAVGVTFLVGCIALVALTAFIVVNPIVMAVAASIIIAAVIGYRGWEFYKKRNKATSEEVSEITVAETATSTSESGKSYSPSVHLNNPEKEHLLSSSSTTRQSTSTAGNESHLPTEHTTFFSHLQIRSTTSTLSSTNTPPSPGAS